MDRRSFLLNSFYSSLLFGTAGLPKIATAQTSFAPLSDRLLVFLNLLGGPDFRHLVAPAMPDPVTSAARNTQAYKYWLHRYRSHEIGDREADWQARWRDHYYPITINDGSVNDGVTFGIWRGAGWLIKMYEAGNVAFVANCSVGRNRAHDRSEVQLRQGNVMSTETDTERSGWGGRLARFTDDNAVSLTYRPSPFCFGPVDSPTYDQNQIDNRNFLSISNSRLIGLIQNNLSRDQTYDPNERLARTMKAYYATLQDELSAGRLSATYDKFMDHEAKLRFFGNQINERLTFEVPTLIRALYENVDGINNATGNNAARRVLRSGNFGEQIRNLYDCIASNDILSLRVAAMQYGNWDSHSQQGDRSNGQDIYNPDTENRGIEQGFRDIFGGPNTTDTSALHGGYSALWESLSSADKDKMVITVAGEFGRQLRNNRDAGTDHGDGNIIMVIGNRVRGGVYGDLFPESEIAAYDDVRDYATPDIVGLTEMEQVFGPVCDWVTNGSGNSANRVFPRLALSTGNDEYPDLEAGVNLTNLFTS